MRHTSILEKFTASVINTAFVLDLSIPFYLLWGFGLAWKWSVITLFFIVEFSFFVLGRDRDLGMRVVGSSWKGRYSAKRHFIYVILYTISFSTVLFYIWLPFDLLFINLLCVQLPTVLLTGTTFHGYLTGLETVKPE
jgi:hypothetical protein